MLSIRVEIIGFKSFAEATEIIIDKGVTAIVGPNGCGKSNITDALLWVIGQASPSKLRSKDLNEVIFAGSGNRPMRDIAEVRLYISGLFSGVENGGEETTVIKRRIERDRGSIWHINDRLVSARKVSLLLAPYFSQANSIIGQETLSIFIKSSSLERRQLLEDAAGIRGLAIRRNNAAGKLKSCLLRMQNLDNVLLEISHSLKKIDKEARQALRYKKIGSQIKFLQRRLLVLKRDRIASDLKDKKQRLSRLNKDLLKYERQKDDSYGYISSLEDKISRVSEREKELEKQLYRSQADIHNLREKIELNAAQDKTLALRMTEIKGDISGFAEKRKTLKKKQSQHLNLRQDYESRRAGDDLDSIKARSEEAYIRFSDDLKRYNDYRAELSALRGQRKERQAVYRKAQIHLSSLEDKRNELEKTEAKLLLRRDELAKKKESSYITEADEASKLEEKINSLSVLCQKERMKKSAAKLLVADLRKQEREIKLPLMEDKLVSKIDVPEDMEKTVNAAWGDELEVHLSGGKKGDDKRWRIFKKTNLSPLPKGVKPLSDFIRVPEHLSLSLSQIGITSDSEIAEKLQEKLRVGQKILSPTGSLWRWDGYVDHKGSHSVYLAEKNRLHRLRRKIETQLKLLKKYEESTHKLESELKDYSSRRKDLLAKIGAIKADNMKLRKLKADIDLSLSGVAERLSDLKTEKKNYEKLAPTAPKAWMDDLSELSSELDLRKTNLDKSRKILDEVKEEYNKKRTLRVYMNSRLKELLAQDKEYSENISYYEAQDKLLKSRLASLLKQKKDAENLPNILYPRLEESLLQGQNASIELKQISDKLSVYRSELSFKRKTERLIESELSAKGKEKQRLATEIEFLSEKFEALKKDLESSPLIKQEQSSGLDEQDLQDLSLQDLSLRIDSLKNKQARMGEVNLRAVTDAEENLLRQQELTLQRDDVKAAMDNLHNAIKLIDKEQRLRLKEAFMATNEKFKYLSNKFFSGGKAWLELSGSNDPLESGLEIFLSLPGKKIKTLNFLSGGERTILSLSLILSSFLVKPSPICVLDEADAALDDSNVKRFCAIISECIESTDSSFIVITHHPLMMSYAHRLYGVTMAEGGVSKVVSVDFQEAMSNSVAYK